MRVSQIIKVEIENIFLTFALQTPEESRDEDREADLQSGHREERSTGGVV